MAVLGGGRSRPTRCAWCRGATSARARRPSRRGRPAVAGPVAAARAGHGLPEPLPAEVLDAAGEPVGSAPGWRSAAPPARLVDRTATGRSRSSAGPARGRSTSAGGRRRRRAGRPGSSWSRRRAGGAARRWPAGAGPWKPSMTRSRHHRGVSRWALHNPDIPWHELERRLSRCRASRARARRLGQPSVPGAPLRRGPARGRRATAATPRPGAASGPPYAAPAARAGTATAPCPYAELHCHTNFSFLDGASHPEELAEEAARLGLTALAVTDHDGFYGVVRFAEAARELRPADHLRRRAVAGAARAAERRARPGRPPPAGARARPGGLRPAVPRHRRRRSCAGGEKGRPVYGPGRGRRGAARTTCWCSPAAARARCRRRCSPTGVDAAARGAGPADRAVRRGQRRRGADRPRRPVRRRPQRRPRRAGRSAPGCRRSPRTTCTTRPRRGAGWPPRWPRYGPGAAWTRSTAGCRRRPPPTCAAARRWRRGSPRYPGAVARAAELGAELAFDLQPGRARSCRDYQVPAGHTEMSWLRKLTMEGALRALRAAARRTRRRTSSSSTSWR